MFFKGKEKEPQKDQIAPPTHVLLEEDGKSMASTPPIRKENVPTNDDTAKAKEPEQHTQMGPEIIYPSGIQLMLLMMSIFIGMFLISLVRTNHHLHQFPYL